MFQKHRRVVRELIEWNMGTNKKVIQPIINGNNNFYISPDYADSDVKSDGLKTVNTILKDGSDLLGAPGRFLNNIQQYWIASLILILLILICILVLFFIARYYCCGKRKFKKLTRTLIPSSSPSVHQNQTDQPYYNIY